MVFRVEGSRDDPEFARACRVVKGLEDLYGKERYRLHPVGICQQPRCPAVLLSLSTAMAETAVAIYFAFFYRRG